MTKNLNTGIFLNEESWTRLEFLRYFSSEIDLFNKLLEVYSEFLKATSNKIRDNDYPNWTILILLSQTLPLMNNAIELLANGYLRSSEVMVRVVSEAVILSVYFKEFPQTEEEYRKLNYRVFFQRHKIHKMLMKVEKEGKIFITNKELAKRLKWNKIVFSNLFKESSRFLHNNSDVIFDLTKNNSEEDSIKLILGPQLYPKKTLALGLRRLFNTTLFSLVTLGVSLAIVPDSHEKEIMDRAGQVSNNLNLGIK